MTSKVDRRLLGEIEERRQRALAAAPGPASAENRYEITIELTRPLAPRRKGSRAETLADLESQAKVAQASLVEALSVIGVVDFRVLALSNSIKTTLTKEQIAKIAEHPDVKVVRLVKLEKVITGTA